jgi:dipeptidase D
MRTSLTLAGLLFCVAQSAFAAAPPPSAEAVKAAQYAVKTYRTELIDSLGKMVSFNTVADKTIPFDKNPQHLGFKQYLKQQAEKLGLDYTDHGYVMVIGLGQSSERVGIITHGDIQPVDPSKWKKSPFELDATSEPGRLVGRGTEDDKGPIATALYAMKAIQDQKIALSKRLELYVYMAEESDWDPLTDFLKTHVPPQMNITLDAEYPVVSAEKGYGTIGLTVPPQPAPDGGSYVGAFGGGFFGSQIPEDASAVIENATPALEALIRKRGAAQAGMRYATSWQGRQLTIKARGVSAHSSKPEDGVNAISMLADALNVQAWPNSTAGALVNFLNDMIGTGIHGEKFGSIAYRDAFMGPMTLAPTVIKQTDAGIELNINMRRPRGKTNAQVEAEVRAALDQWQSRRIPLAGIKLMITEPWEQQNAPQVPVLLSVFSHFTGIKNAKPISIGGGTNSRLFPSAVSFGPAMPGTVYSGHSEHEFITTRQLLLNLQMYTAVMVELAK